MKKLLLLSIYFSCIVFLPSCEKEEDDTSNMSGQIQLEIESSKNLDNLSLHTKSLSPVEAPSADIEFKWEEIETDGNIKRFISNDILMGNYYFKFTVKYKNGNVDYDYGPAQTHTIQIIPGEMTNVYNIYYP